MYYKDNYKNLQSDKRESLGVGTRKFLLLFSVPLKWIHRNTEMASKWSPRLTLTEMDCHCQLQVCHRNWGVLSLFSNCSYFQDFQYQARICQLPLIVKKKQILQSSKKNCAKKRHTFFNDTIQNWAGVRW